MSEINGITTLVLSLGISIVVGLLTNLLTPHVQDWLNRRSASTRGKTLARLKQEYGRIKLWHDNPALVIIDIAPLVVISLALILLLLFLFVAISGINFAVALSAVHVSKIPTAYSQYQSALKGINIGLGAIGIVTMVSFIRLSAYLADIFRLRNFEKYENAVLARIKVLEESSRLNGPKAI